MTVQSQYASTEFSYDNCILLVPTVFFWSQLYFLGPNCVFSWSQLYFLGPSCILLVQALFSWSHLYSPCPSCILFVPTVFSLSQLYSLHPNCILFIPTVFSWSQTAYFILLRFVNATDLQLGLVFINLGVLTKGNCTFISFFPLLHSVLYLFQIR